MQQFPPQVDPWLIQAPHEWGEQAVSPTAQTLHVKNFLQTVRWAESYSSESSLGTGKQRTRPILIHTYKFKGFELVYFRIPDFFLCLDSTDSSDSLDPDLFSEWSIRFLISEVTQTSHYFSLLLMFTDDWWSWHHAGHHAGAVLIFDWL